MRGGQKRLFRQQPMSSYICNIPDAEVCKDDPAVLVFKYFPNIIEHRDIINLACKGLVDSLYFSSRPASMGRFFPSSITTGSRNTALTGLMYIGSRV